MKTDNKYFLALAFIPMLTGCADYLDTNEYTVDKPTSIAQYEYLNAYKPIKEYLDRAAHPGFLLGTGVSAEDYLKHGNVYLLTNSNFDQVTAGNAMKYASVVADDGTMNFGTVSEFVSAATGAGLSVYGHTLCWHEQQNVKWLNSLIADKEMEIDPNEKTEVVDFEIDFSKESEYNMWHQSPDGTVFSINKELGCLQIDNPAAVDFWAVQYFTFDNVILKKGEPYQMSVTLRGSTEGAVQGNVGDWGDNAEIRIPYTTEWETKIIDFVSATDGTTHGLFQTGDLAGTIQYKSIKISHLETPAAEIGVSLINGGDADNGESQNIISRYPGNGDTHARVVDDAAGTGKVYACSYNANPSEAWDSQLFITSNEPLQEGTKIHVKFRYRATDARTIDTQAHGLPGEYHHWEFIGTLNANTEWQEHEFTGIISADQAGSTGCSSIAFNLASAPSEGTFYIDDVVFEKIISSNTIPMTPEEKAEVLTAEMERWIKGMMSATEGKVKAWDVVNEPLSGGPWGQRYDLQHAANTENPENKFFWQDYLGDDYVRIPVKFVRQYFEENGGDPSELKLFINDYNLESDWDDNQKLKSLISWIEQWESDGETKIDGIGTQMHINYYLNPQTQKNKEDHIVKMLELMAASGKLVRITELDMGICDENGNSIKTADVTFEQQQLMAEHYKWIIQKYFEIIPLSQQYGICQWAQTDSPEGSGWRSGEPIGLWDLNFSRKPTYGGFAEGIKGN